MASTFDFDLVLVGGGVAGPAAAVFLARADLETLVFDRGASSIRQCAHLGNYLGFPAGVDAATFLDLAHAHLQQVGIDRREERVTSVARTTPAHAAGDNPAEDGDIDGNAGFRIETDEGNAVTARRVIAATKYDGGYLEPLADGSLVEPREGVDGLTVDGDAVDRAGRTSVDGLYVAGPLGGAPDQAQIAAGDGARVARAVINDVLRERGYWPTAADLYYDWRVRESAYEPGWDEEYADWLRGTAPDDVTDDVIERVVGELIEREREHAVSSEEADRYAAAGQRAILEHLDDDVIRSYLHERE